MKLEWELVNNFVNKSKTLFSNFTQFSFRLLFSPIGICHNRTSSFDVSNSIDQKNINSRLIFHFGSVDVKMRFVKQSIEIPVKNIDEFSVGDQPKTRRHSTLLPNNLRCIISGPSNCGKTNLLISLIESKHGIKFENLYLYSKTLGQDKYKYLENMLAPVKGIGYYAFNNCENVVPPNKAKRNSVFVFDDVICDKNQESVRNLFCMGRHYQTDVIYLTQTLTKLSKHLLRDNANFVILFKQDDLNLRHAYQDFNVNCDLTFDEFKKLCTECWQQRFGFVVIDLESKKNNGRYRRNFNEFLQIDKTSV